MRCLLVICALAGVAHADGDRAFSVGGGYGTFSVPATVPPGQTPPTLSPDFGLVVDGVYAHGLSSELSLRAEALVGGFYGGAQKGESNLSYAALADVGALFKFDVLKYVPYAFAGLGPVVAGGGPIATDVTWVLAIGGGLEIESSRTRSWGIEGRLASFAGDITVFTFEYHRSCRWGFF